MKDSEIDTTEIPPGIDWSKAVVNALLRSAMESGGNANSRPES
jgi:hypothetical protein